MAPQKFKIVPKCEIHIEATRIELLVLAQRLDRGVGYPASHVSLITLNIGGWILSFTPEDYEAFRQEIESYLVVGGEHL